MLHGFINELDDVKSVLTTQDYLELCAALKVLHESKEMEATFNDDTFSRNIRARCVGKHAAHSEEFSPDSVVFKKIESASVGTKRY